MNGVPGRVSSSAVELSIQTSNNRGIEWRTQCNSRIIFSHCNGIRPHMLTPALSFILLGLWCVPPRDLFTSRHVFDITVRSLLSVTGTGQILLFWGECQLLVQAEIIPWPGIVSFSTIRMFFQTTIKISFTASAGSNGCRSLGVEQGCSRGRKRAPQRRQT